MPKNPSHTLTLKARAKVNLTLEVLGRREDGYHDIVSIIQTIDLCDTLTLEPADAISLECDKPELQSPDNLVLKAAYLLKASTGYDWGVRITLMKGIPISAGLGGGSSDAAATLTGLNTLWGLGQSLDELSALAAQLGSDAPFFLHGGTAMVQGKGERVRIMSPAVLPRKDEWLVILKPDIEVEQKTASLYGRLTDANFTRGALTRKLEARINGGGDTPPQFLFNAFDDVAYEAFPGLESYWNTLYSLGAREIHLAGSGPSLFAPVSRKEVGTALHLMLKHQHGMEAYLASTWHPAEEAQK